MRILEQQVDAFMPCSESVRFYDAHVCPRSTSYGQEKYGGQGRQPAAQDERLTKAASGTCSDGRWLCFHMFVRGKGGNVHSLELRDVTAAWETYADGGRAALIVVVTPQLLPQPARFNPHDGVRLRVICTRAAVHFHRDDRFLDLRGLAG